MKEVSQVLGFRGSEFRVGGLAGLSFFRGSRFKGSFVRTFWHLPTSTCQSTKRAA